MNTMTRALTMAAAVAVLLLAGCGTPADDPGGHPADLRAPDAVGTVTSVAVQGDAVLLGFQPDAGYGYYEGTTFVVEGQGAVVDSAGTTIAAASIQVGDRIEVWTEICMESFPVQCPKPSIRLEG